MIRHRYCAWCDRRLSPNGNEPIGPALARALHPAGTSHGICNPCLAEYGREQLGKAAALASEQHTTAARG